MCLLLELCRQSAILHEGLKALYKTLPKWLNKHLINKAQFCLIEAPAAILLTWLLYFIVPSICFKTQVSILPMCMASAVLVSLLCIYVSLCKIYVMIIINYPIFAKHIKQAVGYLRQKNDTITNK